MDKIFSTVDNTLGSVMTKPTVIRGIIHLFLILYASRLSPVPPKQILVLFENVYFKLACFSLILYSAQFSPSTSILIALAFMVTMNYSTTGKVWEMMGNLAQTQQPIAPSREIAINAINQTMASQNANTPVVTSLTQNPKTIVITPSIVNTPNGKSLVNPTVIVAPATITGPSGQTVTVTPNVSLAKPQPQSPQSQPQSQPTVTQSIQAVQTLGKAAASPSASNADAVSNIAKVAVANVTSKPAVDAIGKLVSQAIVPQAGVPNKVNVEVAKVIKSITPAAAPSVIAAASNVAKSATPVAQTSGCFPMRQYDMSKVAPQVAGLSAFEDYQIWTPSK